MMPVEKLESRMPPQKNPKPKGLFNRFLNVIEFLGNKLPHPFFLFAILAGLVIVASFALSFVDTSFTHPGTGEEMQVKNLLSGEGLVFILTSMLENFTGFAPLGLVLSIMLGVGLADKVGLLNYVIQKTILKAPPALLTYTIIFVGMLGNLASDAAFILIPPLSAMVFYKVGRHPIVGLCAGFAAVGAGLTANIFVAGTDALLAGISTEAAAIIDPNMVVTPVANWYFNIVSVFVLTIVGGLVTNKVIEPRLGKYTGDAVVDDMEETHPKASKGLKLSLLAGAVYIAAVALTVLVPASPLRNEDGGLIPSPFLDGIVPLILLFFLVIAIPYGLTVGKIKTTKDIGNHMTESMKELAGYIVLIFAVAQFIAYFSWSNMGTWLATTSGEFLSHIQFTGIGLIILYVLFTAALNFLIPSGSAKWALEAPVFIPLFMQLGYHPGFAQAAYRMADSSMNIVTPLDPFLIIVLSFMQKYDKKAGIGSLISLMVPYALCFFVTWLIIFLAFFFLGIPYGPGVGPYL